MYRRLRLLSQNTFVRHNGIFFAGSLAVSVLNYLYYPILGRLMPTVQFGETQALVSLFLQATIFLTVVTNVAVSIVANEPDQTHGRRVIYELEYLMLLVTLAALALLLVWVEPLRRFLQFDEATPFYALAAALLLGVPLALRTAYMRGRAAFGAVSAANILASITKIVFSVVFVLVGWGTLGAIGGIVAAQLIAAIFAIRRARRYGLAAWPRLGWLRRPDPALVRPYLRYSLLVLVVSLIMTILFSFDVVLAKHLFSAETAGLYAGVATIARIIYFLTASIAAVLLATAKLSAGVAANRRLLMRSMLLQLIIGGVALAVFVLAPHLVIELLVGAKYLVYADLLPRLALALFVLALINLIFNYDLALRRRSAAVVALLSGLIMTMTIAWSHHDPEALVNGLLAGALLILVVRAGDTIRRRLWPPASVARGE
jgi:O-antigen/teichoic acid export membrane protein